jgi:hypothetical protein
MKHSHIKPVPYYSTYIDSSERTLAAALSALTAPLMLVPVWLEIKRRWNVPLAIFMDDILILCQSKEQIVEIYDWLHNRLLSDYDLELNVTKSEAADLQMGN